MPVPQLLLDSLQGLPGFEENSFVQVHESGEQVVSIRMNPEKKIIPAFELMQKIPWASEGFYLPSRPSFTSDPFFHGGAYYVQEASSMFLEFAIRQTCDISATLKVLDVCAAPGGKSTLIQSVISAQSVLVSNEIIKQRSGILEENITKWGTANVIVTNNKPSDFSHLEGLFDLIVVDAPCSGSGLFRKDPQAIEEWSPHNVRMCSVRQQEILQDILPCLKENGILIYSTCSYSRDENENIVLWLTQLQDVVSVPLKPMSEWNIVEVNENGFGYRFYPDKLKGEGFFLAALQKTSSNECSKRFKKSNIFSDHSVLEKWIRKDVVLQFIKHKDSVIGLPETTLVMLQWLEGLYIKKAGILLGDIIRNEIIPSHALAVSNIVSPLTAFIEVSLEEALQYLRKSEWAPQTNLKGWVLIKFNSIALGWVKVIGNRINNYYPKEWRILNK